MRVLWLSNVLFPEICEELKIPTPVVGGWMYAGAKALIERSQNINLSVAALYDGNDLQCVEKFNIKYYLIPKSPIQLQEYFKQIKENLKPDLVHIHGTEYPHSLAYVEACGSENVVVSIQGMVSIYAEYYLGGIAKNDIKISLRDIIRRDSLFTQQSKMAERGEQEIILLKHVQHIIGRTSWDHSNTWAINPQAKYHFCNETLRSLFYKTKWSYDNCEVYTIFLSQANYPIKGIQQLIKALPLIKTHYPNVKVYISGNNPFNVPFLRKNGFALYLEKMMKKYNVEDNIEFVGLLNEEEMTVRYQKSHIFVCPSYIENSPNSVGEAQLVGIPCVASYVGGTMDMIQDGKTGFLYRFEEVALLAFRICQLFGSPELCDEISNNSRVSAKERHDSLKNAQTLIDIYNSILSND